MATQVRLKEGWRIVEYGTNDSRVHEDASDGWQFKWRDDPSKSLEKIEAKDDFHYLAKRWVLLQVPRKSCDDSEY